MRASEIGILTILVKHPSLARVLQDNILITDDSMALFNVLYNEAGINPNSISKTVLAALLKRNNIKIDNEILNQVYRDLSSIPKDPSVAKRDLIQLINLLTREANTDTILNVIKRVESLVRSNKLDEAYNLIRGIHFNRTEEIQDTQQLMINSVEQTSGFRSGVKEIDEHFGAFVKGNITSLVSDSGAMKTYFAMWFQLQVLIANPKFTGVFFEKEMPAKDIGRRLLSYIVKESSMQILQRSIDNHKESIDYYSKQMKEMIDDTTSDLLKRFITIPNNKFDTPMDMLRYIELYNADICTLDYMTQLESDLPGNTNYNEKIMHNINSLKRIVNETETHLININQANKDNSGSLDKRILDAKQIEWSKNIENVSANVISLFYPYKHYKTFKKAAFMTKAPNIVEYQKYYYYIIDLKSRETSSKEPMLLKALPENSKFEEFDAEERVKALMWYEAYEEFVTPKARK